MEAKTILLSLLPVPLFYLIYYRYFTFRLEYYKHIQFFLAGLAFAILLKLIPQNADSMLVYHSPLYLGFIRAALIEKLGAFIIIYILLKGFPHFNIMESTLTAMLFGIGFSCVENIFYIAHSGLSLIILRVIFSVPLHLTTCGFIGYYLGMNKLCKTKVVKLSFGLKAFFLAYIFHGLFDTLLFMGGKYAYLTAPLLIFMVIVLEILMAHSQTIIPLEILKVLKIRFEDWLTIYRQPRYERWIYQSSGIQGVEPVHFFLWRPGILRFLFVILCMVVAIFGLSFRSEIMKLLELTLHQEDEIIFLGIFPSSISLIIILVGAVNPQFFKKSKIEMPIIFDVDVYKGEDFVGSLITYDITVTNCFLRTAESFCVGSEVTLQFKGSNMMSPKICGRVCWENHANKHEAIGTIVKFTEIPQGFYGFFLRYHILRTRKGLFFNLRLPGFETNRKFFMRPISTMQEEIFFEAGTIIFREGDRGRKFYLLKKGKVIFYKNKESGGIITMDIADAGEIFGEMAIIGNNTRAVSAMCASDCILAVADKDNINALIVNNFEFAHSLIQTLSQRVQMSEKILIGNIKNLEKKERDLEKHFYVAALLMIMGIDATINEKNNAVHLDLQAIHKLVPDIDKGIIKDIIQGIIQKEVPEDEEYEGQDRSLLETIEKLYARLDLDIDFKE